jgi:hypothetical protein
MFQHLYDEFEAKVGSVAVYHDSIPVSRVMTCEHEGLKVQMVAFDSAYQSSDDYVDSVFDLAFLKNTYDGRRLNVHRQHQLRTKSAPLVRTDGHITVWRDVSRRDKYAARGFFVSNFSFTAVRQIFKDVDVRTLLVDGKPYAELVRGRDIKPIFNLLRIPLRVEEQHSKQPWVSVFLMTYILQDLNQDGENKKAEEKARKKLLGLFPLSRKVCHA